MTLYLPKSCGWGNALMMVVDEVMSSENPRVYKSVMEYECDAFDWRRFDIATSKKEDPYEAKVIINPHYYSKNHVNIQSILEPTEKMKEMIKKYDQGCKWGMHIRRGAYSKDSENMGCHGLDENGNIKKAFFANDVAIEKFKKIVESKPGKFFLASDSQEIKDMFKKLYPDKIVTLDNNAVLTYDCDFLKNDVSKADRFATYLEWFLLAKSKYVFITAGNKDMTDFSTFGYTAACFGDASIQFVTNY